MVAAGMALSRRNVALWFLAACSVAACGDKFTAAAASDAGGGNAGTGGTIGGAAGSSGGSTAGRGGRAGSAGAQASGGDSGAAGTSAGSAGADGTGSDGASGMEGAGSGGTGGAGGSGGTGISGAAGTGGGGSGGVVACGVDEARCGDGRCAKLSWNFDSGTLEGIVVASSSGQPLAVRDFQGSPALAMDVAELNVFSELSFYVPVCTSGSADLRARTLSFRLYFDGSPASTFEFFAQVAVPDPGATGAFLDSISAGTGAWVDYSSPLSKSGNSSSVTKFTIRVGSTGASFGGTIWFDDIKIR